MIGQRLSMRGQTGPLAYIIFAPLITLVQHSFVIWAFWWSGRPLVADAMFWAFPIRQLNLLQGLETALAAASFLVCLGTAAALAVLSFRRANWSRRGYAVALFTLVPSIQVLAILIMAVIPKGTVVQASIPVIAVAPARQILLGFVSGMTIIVAGVVISAPTFGAYGWGLLVMTPFLVGLTTGYLVNRGGRRTIAATLGLVAAAGMLGSLALLMLALEGLMCIILILPLAAMAASAGGLIGRLFAGEGHDPAQPFLCVAALPFLFALEAVTPPELPLTTHTSIDIAAPPPAVWDALVSADPIASDPGVVGMAGLAYPIASHLLGEGVGTIRLGQFSTGTAREQVTRWEPGRALAFRVISQPPTMEEMSPYRQVHAPHLNGYFDTGETRFVLDPLPGGGTRLSITATHVLRIDPALYWGPIARWAIRENVDRVLADIAARAVRQGTSTVSTAAAAVAG